MLGVIVKFGAHMSISGGLHNAFTLGQSVGCESLQIFTKNQQQWRAKPLSDLDITAFAQAHAQYSDWPLVVHDSYLINLASPKDDLWEKSIAAFGEELTRCDQLNIPYIVTHPGAHTGSGEDVALEREAVALNRLFNAGIGGNTMVLLETTAGQGTTLGYRFEHLARLFELVDRPERLGVCVDTCHLLAAGYDIRTPKAYEQTFAEFDRILGVEHIKVFHLNDSQKDLGSRVDRHTHIGEGFVGLEAFRCIVNDPRFAHLPAILETPKGEDLADDVRNLATLRGLVTA
jgi:deoxyribonuclease-4